MQTGGTKARRKQRGVRRDQRKCSSSSSSFEEAPTFSTGPLPASLTARLLLSAVLAPPGQAQPGAHVPLRVSRWDPRGRVAALGQTLQARLVICGRISRRRQTGWVSMPTAGCLGAARPVNLRLRLPVGREANQISQEPASFLPAPPTLSPSLRIPRRDAASASRVGSARWRHQPPPRKKLISKAWQGPQTLEGFLIMQISLAACRKQRMQAGIEASAPLTWDSRWGRGRRVQRPLRQHTQKTCPLCKAAS